MKILIACEFSGIVRDAFIAKGHDVISCDLLPTEKQGPHYQGNVFDIINDGFDLMIAHPPCTYLANSGVQHLHKDKNRWNKMEDGKNFFLKLFNSNINKICIENPVPHHYCELPKYNQIIEPFMFGHEATKKTCLWLKNLPVLIATKIVYKGERYIGKNGKSNGAMWYQLPEKGERWKIRSRTFIGIAEAMAEQWG